MGRARLHYGDAIRRICGHIFFILLVVLLLLVLKFRNILLELNSSGVESSRVAPREACPSVCQTMYPSSTRKSFSTLTDSTGSLHRLIIVHITNNTLSPDEDDDVDYFIIDINNLLWAESVEEPLLSFDFFFNVYSFTTLSLNVRQLTTTVQVRPENCIRNFPSMFCAVSSVARGFLANVTKQRGVLCYVGPVMSYKCCQWDKENDDVICNITVVQTASQTAITVTLAIAAGFAVLCFPAIVTILPDKTFGNQMTSNSHLNPFSQAAISGIQLLYLTGHYWLDVLRKLFMFLVVFPFWFYLQLIIFVYIQNYEIPKMFSSDWAKQFAENSISDSIYFFNKSSYKIVCVYVLVVLLFSLVPQSNTFSVSDSSSKFYAEFELIRSLKENNKRHLKLDFCFPFSFYFRHVVQNTLSCIRFAVALRNFQTLPGFVAIFFTSLILSPFICALFFVGYLYSVSPMGIIIDIWILHLTELDIWCTYRLSGRFGKVITEICNILVLIFVIILLTILSLAFVMFAMIIFISLSLITKLISYTTMGLAANLSFFSPYIALVSIFLFYAWSCSSSVTSEYHKLLKLTIQECEQKQKERSELEKGALYREENYVLIIPSTLFYEVCDEVLPRTEAYTFMVLKLITITLFMAIAFASIMVFGENAGSSQLMTVFATLLAGILPKLVSMFGQGSSAKQLQDIALSKRVKIVIENSNYLQYLGENRSQQVDVDIEYPELPVEIVDMIGACVSSTSDQQLSRDVLDCRQQDNAKPTRDLVDGGNSEVLFVEADVHPIPPLLQSTTSDTVHLIPSDANEKSNVV